MILRRVASTLRVCQPGGRFEQTNLRNSGGDRFGSRRVVVVAAVRRLRTHRIECRARNGDLSQHADADTTF